MLTEGVQGRHQRATLLAALALQDVAWLAVVVAPQVPRPPPVELADEGQQAAEIRRAPQCTEHEAAAYVAERAHAVEGDQGGGGVQFGERPHHSGDA
eukprot:8530954-Alexandrium_andersonii.AAC.1